MYELYIPTSTFYALFSFFTFYCLFFFPPSLFSPMFPLFLPEENRCSYFSADSTTRWTHRLSPSHYSHRFLSTDKKSQRDFIIISCSPCSVWRHCPVRMSHTRTVESAFPETRMLSRSSMPLVSDWWPVNVWTHPPEQEHEYSLRSFYLSSMSYASVKNFVTSVRLNEEKFTFRGQRKTFCCFN